MSQETTFVDPRSNVTHPLDEGQVYEDSRTGRELVLVFLSEEAALLRDTDDHHILEGREQFEANVGADRYTLQASESGEAASATVTNIERLRDRYEQQDGRTAAHKVEALDEALELIEHNGRPDDNETIPFEDIDGIGERAATALRANGFSTKGDVRSVDRETIEDVPNMGAKNTTALLDFVNDE